MPNFIKRVCIEPKCNKPFVISLKEKKFYEEKGWELPKRCKECRQKRKAAKEKKNAAR